jgi:uncharacterized Zn finger protein (UPF0148 family)
MDVRGNRVCQDCGAEWSYYETGSITCPECGSVRSVGVGERRTHTDRPVELDLSAAKEAAARSVREAADPAAEAAMAYVRARGFIDAGELEPLDETYLAAHEIRHAASILGRRLDVSEDEEYYFTRLLDGADAGERPPAEEVPETLRAARGLATAAAVRAYREDLRTWLADRDVVDAVHGLVGSLGTHVRRVRALEGEVPAADADRIAAAADAVGGYLRDGDESELERARALLERVE